MNLVSSIIDRKPKSEFLLQLQAVPVGSNTRKASNVTMLGTPDEIKNDNLRLWLTSSHAYGPEVYSPWTN